MDEESSGSRMEFAEIEHADIGITCERSSPFIAGCTIRSNTTAGIFCLGGSPVIAANSIFDNGSGIVIKGEESIPSIRMNLICHNFGSGLMFEENTSSAEWVSYNSISHNLENGIEIMSGTTIPGIYMCNIVGNANYDIRLGGIYGVEATSCFWGGETTQEMLRKGSRADIQSIFDGHDKPGLGFVRYDRLLDEMVDIEKKISEEGPIPIAEEMVNQDTSDLVNSIQRGYVVNVNPDREHEMNDHGRSSAIEKGMRFSIARDDEFIGEMKITDILGKVSVGKVTESSAEPRRGDKAIPKPVLVLSDVTWIGVDRLFDDWNQISLDSSKKHYWTNCVEIEPRKSYMSGEAEEFLAETGASCIWEMHTRAPGTIYMRNEFTLKGKCGRAELEVMTPARCEVYLNGVKMGTVVPDWQRNVVWSEKTGYIVTDFIVHGKNVIAVTGDPKPREQAPPVGLILRLRVWPRI
jgi:hypothetical protein